MKMIQLLTLLGTALLAQKAVMADLIHLDFPKEGVTTCTGGNNICNATVNAIGDMLTFDVKGLPLKELALPTAGEKVLTISLPQKVQEALVYSLKPTQGDFAGQEIRLLVQNQLERAGTRLANKKVFKLARQLKGDAATHWTDVGDLKINKTDTLQESHIIAHPDGTLESFDTEEAQLPVTIDTNKPLPDGVKRVLFLVGKKDLGRSKNSPASAA